MPDSTDIEVADLAAEWLHKHRDDGGVDPAALRALCRAAFLAGVRSAGGVLVPVEPRPAKQDLRPYALSVYEHWRRYHPTAKATPTEDDAKKLLDRVREVAKDDGPNGALDACVDVVEWAHNAADAAFYRGANNRQHGGKPAQYLGIRTLFKREGFGDRLEKARAWRAGGAEPDADLGIEQYQGEAEKAWAYVTEAVAGGAARDPLAGNPAPKAVAFSAGVQACGGWLQIRQSRDFDQPALRKAFVAGYLQARVEVARG